MLDPITIKNMLFIQTQSHYIIVMHKCITEVIYRNAGSSNNYNLMVATLRETSQTQLYNTTVDPDHQITSHG